MKGRPVCVGSHAGSGRDRLCGDTGISAVSTSVNEHVATKLGEVADLLEQQAANPFRVRAYRRAAETVAGLDRDLQAIVQHGGPEALVELPNIGAGIASAIDEILRTGRWVQLERLRGSLDPVNLFQTVPGIGPAKLERYGSAFLELLRSHRSQ